MNQNKKELKVYAGSVANLTDARYFSSMGAEFIGFDFDPLSPNYISPQNARDISAWLEGPSYIGEFANQDMDNIINICGFMNLKGISLSLNDDILDKLIENIPDGFDLYIKLPIESLEDSKYLLSKLFSPNSGPKPVLLIDLQQDENEGVSEDLRELLNRACENHTCFLKCMQATDEMLELIQSSEIQGICLEGGAELKTGIKSFEDLDKWFEILDPEF